MIPDFTGGPESMQDKNEVYGNKLDIKNINTILLTRVNSMNMGSLFTNVSPGP